MSRGRGPPRGEVAAPVTRHNFADLAPCLDVLFGTYHRRRDPETYAARPPVPPRVSPAANDVQAPAS